MESTLSEVIASSELVPVHGKGATPFAQQTVVLTKQAYIELSWQANYVIDHGVEGTGKGSCWGSCIRSLG